MSAEAVMYPLDLFPDYNIHIALFENVKNIKALRKELLSGKLQCSLIDVTLLPSIFPVLIAANKSVHNYMNSSMKTRNLHTEILFNLSPTSGITDSLKTFGVKDSHTNVLLVAVRNTEEKDIGALLSQVEGETINTEHLAKLFDESSIMKLYKITSEELEIGSLSDAIVARVTAKEFL